MFILLHKVLKMISMWYFGSGQITYRLTWGSLCIRWGWGRKHWSSGCWQHSSRDHCWSYTTICSTAPFCVGKNKKHIVLVHRRDGGWIKSFFDMWNKWSAHMVQDWSILARAGAEKPEQPLRLSSIMCGFFDTELREDRKISSNSYWEKTTDTRTLKQPISRWPWSWDVLDDVVRELQTLQAQVAQQPAATDDALQSRGGDDGAGQIHDGDLQRAEQQRDKKNQTSSSAPSQTDRKYNVSYLKMSQ